MYKITTQRWSMVRLSQTPGSPWISTPGNYLLNYKDCVEVKVFANAPEEMFWNPATEEAARRGFNPPPTQYFDYTQQFNYTPVFVVTDAITRRWKLPRMWIRCASAPRWCKTPSPRYALICHR
jgi:hypothetical protein